MCPGSSYPNLYNELLSYYIKWVTTSWTYGMIVGFYASFINLNVVNCVTLSVTHLPFSCLSFTLSPFFIFDYFHTERSYLSARIYLHPFFCLFAWSIICFSFSLAVKCSTKNHYDSQFACLSVSIYFFAIYSKIFRQPIPENL